MHVTSLIDFTKSDADQNMCFCLHCKHMFFRRATTLNFHCLYTPAKFDIDKFTLLRIFLWITPLILHSFEQNFIWLMLSILLTNCSIYFMHMWPKLSVVTNRNGQVRGIFCFIGMFTLGKSIFGKYFDCKTSDIFGY